MFYQAELKPSLFAKLSMEIRFMIYGLLPIQQTHFPCGTSRQFTLVTTTAPTAILLTCKAIYLEARTIIAKKRHVASFESAKILVNGSPWNEETVLEFSRLCELVVNMWKRPHKIGHGEGLTDIVVEVEKHQLSCDAMKKLVKGLPRLHVFSTWKWYAIIDKDGKLCGPVWNPVDMLACELQALACVEGLEPVLCTMKTGTWKEEVWKVAKEEWLQSSLPRDVLKVKLNILDEREFWEKCGVREWL